MESLEIWWELNTPMFANVSPEVLPSRKNPTTCKYIRGGGVLYYRVHGIMDACKNMPL